MASSASDAAETPIAVCADGPAGDSGAADPIFYLVLPGRDLRGQENAPDDECQEQRLLHRASFRSDNPDDEGDRHDDKDKE